jgi:hypothetical protein
MKKISTLTLALLGSVTLSPDLSAVVGTEYTPGAALTAATPYSPGTVLLNNTDGTRPRISFKPISGALEGDYTLVQMVDNRQVPLLKLTIHDKKITKIETLSEPEADEGIALAGGIWRFNRDQQTPLNPKGTRIQPGRLFFILKINEGFGIPLSMGSQAWFHQESISGTTRKLEALNFDLNTNFVYAKYAPMGEVAAPSMVALLFDRQTYGFLDNRPLLEKTAKAIEGYENFLSKRDFYNANEVDSLTFSATQEARKLFIFGLAKAYLQNLFKEPANQIWLNRFKTMGDVELKSVAGSLVSWFQEATVSGQRILTEVEKNTFLENVLGALRSLQADMVIIVVPPKPMAVKPTVALEAQPPKAVTPLNRVQEIKKQFEEQKIKK